MNHQINCPLSDRYLFSLFLMQNLSLLSLSHYLTNKLNWSIHPDITSENIIDVFFSKEGNSMSKKVTLLSPNAEGNSDCHSVTPASQPCPGVSQPRNVLPREQAPRLPRWVRQLSNCMERRSGLTASDTVVRLVLPFIK